MSGDALMDLPVLTNEERRNVAKEIIEVMRVM